MLETRRRDLHDRYASELRRGGESHLCAVAGAGQVSAERDRPSYYALAADLRESLAPITSATKASRRR